MAAITKDDVWKAVSLLMSALVLPLAGWVWTVNVEVAQLRNDLGDLERHVAELEAAVEEQEEATKTLIKVQSDLGHVREILNRIERLVTE